MKKVKLKGLELDVYKGKLDNGLLVYICPMEKHDTHASIVVRYGNDVLEFVPRGKNDFTKIPPGTAHFLEHKMFATEEGLDPMILFSNNGASSNAYTSSNVTRYYFTGASHFYDNLKILLDCITTPYFTKENIEKEQGIIEQEIKAGFDDPGHMAYFLACKSLFKSHPHKYPVAGYVDSIKKLTPEMLYDCYNTFYHPDNMYLVITGNVDPDEAFAFVQNYYQGCNFMAHAEIKVKQYAEKGQVAIKKAVETMDITKKILTINYKVKVDNTKCEKFFTNLYLLIYLDILFSEMSDLYDENHHDKNILRQIEYYIENVEDYVAIYFDIEVIDDEGVLKKINDTINQKEFTEEDFKLISKNLVKSAILSTENVNGVANLIVNQELLYDKFHTDFYDKYKNLSYQDCKEFIESLDFSNYSIGIIKKEE